MKTNKESEKPTITAQENEYLEIIEKSKKYSYSNRFFIGQEWNAPGDFFCEAFYL